MQNENEAGGLAETIVIVILTWAVLSLITATAGFRAAAWFAGGGLTFAIVCFWEAGRNIERRALKASASDSVEQHKGMENG